MARACSDIENYVGEGLRSGDNVPVVLAALNIEKQFPKRLRVPDPHEDRLTCARSDIKRYVDQGLRSGDHADTYRY